MEEKQKTAGELRREALLYQPKNGYDRLSAQDEADMKSYCEDYKKFLDAGKTERECVTEAVRLAEAKGFKPFTRGMAVNPGDKLYRINRGKALMLAVVGTRPLSEGVNIGAAHIDSPRLDLKPNPLYEDAELAFFKTHYYGGIRKYQWVTIPLELRGVVALKDGSTVAVSIGGAPEDPQFTIDDLLPHLGVEQSKKPLGEAIPGESLNHRLQEHPLHRPQSAGGPEVPHGVAPAEALVLHGQQDDIGQALAQLPHHDRPLLRVPADYQHVAKLEEKPLVAAQCLPTRRRPQASGVDLDGQHVLRVRTEPEPGGQLGVQVAGVVEQHVAELRGVIRHIVLAPFSFGPVRLSAGKCPSNCWSRTAPGSGALLPANCLTGGSAG